MRLVVVDASALVEYLLRTGRAAGVAGVIESSDADLHVPALCDVEFAWALRRALRVNILSTDRAKAALADYRDLPITRHGHLGLLTRIIDLRETFSAYGAAYVVLAQGLGASLLTADERLARAVQAHTELEMLSTL